MTFALSLLRNDTRYQSWRLVAAPPLKASLNLRFEHYHKVLALGATDDRDCKARARLKHKLQPQTNRIRRLLMQGPVGLRPAAAYFEARH